MDNRATLLVLAAGMGSRYGGLKQLDAMGPSGETMLDYSVYDAVRAGFKRIVFVIRKDIESAFREAVGSRYDDRVSIDYAFQDLEDIPEPFNVPADRVKPWGTGHALRAARDKIDGNFAVINADDFYGAEAYQELATHFSDCDKDGLEPFCMVGYPLANTLSPHGSVNRGVCEVKEGRLLSVEEYSDIKENENGSLVGMDSGGRPQALDPASPVSMNFWGFSSAVFPSLEEQFVRFLKTRGTEMKSEFYIPSFVDTRIREEGQSVEVLKTNTSWFGVTYPLDKPFVQERLGELIEAGIYPTPLTD